MYAKKGGRVTFRSNRRVGYKRNSNFSNGKVRNKGNISQQYNKYLKLAKEASSSGDRIQAEYYYQFTDHYSRWMMELGIVLDDNDNTEQSVTEEKNNDVNESKEKEIDQNESNNDNQVEEKDDRESIQSIPFISEPIKKKTSKIKKAN